MRAHGTRARAAKAGLGALALVSVACSVETKPYSTDTETGSRHALIRIERITSLDEGTEQATALAGFVEVPANVDADVAMRLVGMYPSLPAAGQCIVTGHEPESSTPLNPLGQVTFLDAGQVRIRASEQADTLAPHAFPTVTDSISGVVYASRDREAESLPASAEYAIEVAGSAELAALKLSAKAPEPLRDAYAAGQPISELASVGTQRPLDLTWGTEAAPSASSATADLIYVELASDSRDASVVCGFPDQAGAGSVPTASFAPGEGGSIAIHRLRSYAFDASGVDEARVGFDFQLTASIVFGE